MTNESEHTNISMFYSTFSMSAMSGAVSANERRKLDDFIHGLRQDSEGALEESAGNTSLLNTSTEDSIASQHHQRAGFDTVVRRNKDPEIPLPRTHRRISSVETELIGNTSDGAHMEDEDAADNQNLA